MRTGKKIQANAIAFIWGLAEATVFFIVPDILLSWYALSNQRRGLIACGFALAGALIGGAMVWLAAREHAETMRSAFESIPAIDAAMIAGVQTQLADAGVSALFSGPLRGIPYKIYALEAADLGIGLVVFLAVSIPARLMRFAGVTLLAGTVARLLQHRFSLRSVQMTHIVCWCAFYGWYFWAMAGRNPV